MKTIVKRSLILLAGMVLFQGYGAFAQEEDKTKVHLKVKKDDTLTLDTTLHIKTGAESVELKKLLEKGCSALRNIHGIQRSGWKKQRLLP